MLIVLIIYNFILIYLSHLSFINHKYNLKILYYHDIDIDVITL